MPSKKFSHCLGYSPIIVPNPTFFFPAEHKREYFIISSHNITQAHNDSDQNVTRLKKQKKKQYSYSNRWTDKERKTKVFSLFFLNWAVSLNLIVGPQTLIAIQLWLLSYNLIALFLSISVISAIILVTILQLKVCDTIHYSLRVSAKPEQMSNLGSILTHISQWVIGRSLLILHCHF